MHIYYTLPKRKFQWGRAFFYYFLCLEISVDKCDNFLKWLSVAERRFDLICSNWHDEHGALVFCCSNVFAALFFIKVANEHTRVTEFSSHEEHVLCTGACILCNKNISFLLAPAFFEASVIFGDDYSNGCILDPLLRTDIRNESTYLCLVGDTVKMPRLIVTCIGCTKSRFKYESNVICGNISVCESTVTAALVY